MGPDFMKTPAMKLFAAMSVFSMAAPVDAEPQAPRTSSASVGYTSPAKGSPLRKAILDGLRPLAVAKLGGPIEFVVDELRVSGDIAYVELWAQRPGGITIKPESTPAFRSGEWPREDVQMKMFDQRWISGFMRRRDGRWQVWQQGTSRGIIFGATEGWWVEDCRGLERLMPETCG